MASMNVLDGLPLSAPKYSGTALSVLLYKKKIRGQQII